jgi:hypothetical protein
VDEVRGTCSEGSLATVWMHSVPVHDEYGCAYACICPWPRHEMCVCVCDDGGDGW